MGARVKRATVPVAELKKRLSYYLKRVHAGESILIADRDHVIARIERVRSSLSERGSDAEWLDRLETSGIIRRGAGKLSPAWLARRPEIGANLLAALLDERNGGR